MKRCGVLSLAMNVDGRNEKFTVQQCQLAGEIWSLIQRPVLLRTILSAAHTDVPWCLLDYAPFRVQRRWNFSA